MERPGFERAMKHIFGKRARLRDDPEISGDYKWDCCKKSIHDTGIPIKDTRYQRKLRER